MKSQLSEIAFLEDGEPVTDDDIARNRRAEQRIGWKRAAVQTIMFLQIVALYLPALAVVSSTTTAAGAMRTLGVVLCIVLTLMCMGRLNRRTKLNESFERAIVYKVCVFVCEMPLLSVKGDYSVPIIFGFVTIFFTLLCLTVLLLTFKQIFNIVDDLATEEYYTRYVTTDYLNRISSYVTLKKENDMDERFADESETKARQYSGNSLFNKWHRAYLVRRALYRADVKGQSQMCFLYTVLMIFFFISVGYEFAKIFTFQDPIFTPELLDKYNDANRVKQYFPNVSHVSYKVHIIVMDALRDDMTRPGMSAMGDFFATEDFKKHSMKFSARAQLPSFSVPNWMSILTGAPPENHGVTGNLMNGETKFDNMFTQAMKYDVGRGMTGTPWWRQLVFAAVPPLIGDGTIDASHKPPGWPEYDWLTSDPADHERLEAALLATRIANKDPAAYRLFLTHFSDIDKQGHEYGIDTKWNKRDTYRKAIANKTDALKKIIAAIDDNALPTILIITSDHGQVQRGGHGGVSSVLRDTPVVVYSKHLNLTDMEQPPSAFAADLGPWYGGHENLDLSSTVTALLGIPAPRQATGVVLEEVFNALVPKSAQALHWYDLFMAKRDAFMIYHEAVFPWDDSPEKASPLDEPELVALVNESPNDVNPMRYANAIRKILSSLDDLRDYRMNFILIRNLVASLVVFFTVLLMFIVVYDRSSMVSFQALIDMEDPACAANRRALLVSGVCVFAYYVLSVLTFIIGYFSITGYDIWDSTLAHTPSVVGTFVLRTIIAPIIYYILIFRAAVAMNIEWRILDIMRSMQMKVKLTVPLLATWVNCVMSDIATVFVGTHRYKKTSYADVYLFTNYALCWTTFVAQFLLLLEFPYSFIYPVALSSTHVTDFNLEWRFRVITVMIMTAPLLFGLLVASRQRPKLKDQTLATWDMAFLKLVMYSDRYRLVSCEAKGTLPPEELAALPHRKEAMNEAIALIEDSFLRFGSSHVMEMLAMCEGEPTEVHPLTQNEASSDM
eukprot:PhM_4_TR8762/c0_g2_i4/m.37042